MVRFKRILTLVSALVLAGCGGNDQTPKFNSLISFGDSLSDVGTYAVGSVKSLGGGKYTINGPDAKIWIELMASRLSLKAPCPAQTGLDGNSTLGFDVPVMNSPGCTAYAQGGARVTNPIGPGNRDYPDNNSTLGQLTVPVVTQIQSHLAGVGGNFRSDQIIFVMAGANDVFAQLGAVNRGTAPAAAIAAMAATAAELTAYVKNLIVGKGARYVAVINVPDISRTPFGAQQTADIRNLIDTMVTTFNSQLQRGLADTPEVLYVDAYTVNRDQIANPAKYGIANAAVPACDLTPLKNPLGSSLICNKDNLISGAIDNHYFADAVHPTPYGYQLLAQLVTAEMSRKGWIDSKP